MPNEVETQVRQGLAEVYQPEGVDIWMNAKNRNLGGRRAIDLINAGQGVQVLAEVERLVGGSW